MITHNKKGKDITYVTNVRMPTTKAHGTQMIKMCEAFASVGATVVFYVPWRHNPITEDAFSYYDVARTFDIKKLPSIDFIRFMPRFGFLLQQATFTLSVFFRFLFASRKNRIFYTREHYLAALARWLGFDVVYEAHRIPERSGLFFWLVKKVPTIITNSPGVAEEFTERGFDHVRAYPNGIDLSSFEVKTSKEELRNELELPQDKKIALYTGHLFDWKGIDVVLETAALFSLRDPSIHIVCVGGTPEDVEKYRDAAGERDVDSISFLGYKSPLSIPRYLKAADVLLLPNVPISKESIRYTSPVKLPEYMASGTPIVASDMPSIRALVNEGEVVFVSAGDPEALYTGILRVIHDVSGADERAKNALVHVREWTWEKRARGILGFMDLQR